MVACALAKRTKMTETLCFLDVDQPRVRPSDYRHSLIATDHELKLAKERYRLTDCVFLTLVAYNDLVRAGNETPTAAEVAAKRRKSESAIRKHYRIINEKGLWLQHPLETERGPGGIIRQKPRRRVLRLPASEEIRRNRIRSYRQEREARAKKIAARRLVRGAVNQPVTSDRDSSKAPVDPSVHQFRIWLKATNPERYEALMAMPDS